MIFVDDSTIKVGGIVLPGLVKSIEVKDDALIDEQEVEGSSIKAKQVKGYEDAKINIELILEDGPSATRAKKLETIQNLFKKASQTKPIIHEIINEHTAARRIKKVIFKSLGTKEESKKALISVSLEFWSYNTMTIKATKSSTNSAATSSLDPTYQSYLANDRGTTKKTDSSPAVDNASTNAYLYKVARLQY